MATASGALTSSTFPVEDGKNSILRHGPACQEPTRRRVPSFATIRGVRDPWLVRQNPLGRPRLRLFCFPHAGGGASAYRGWERRLPDEVELVVVQLPGRESRLLEPAFSQLHELADVLEGVLRRTLDAPFAFFGHSMGAYIAFELARRLEPRYPLRQLFVSACRAPHMPASVPPLHGLPDTEFIEKLSDRYQEIPLEVRESEELMELVLPNLRADLELVETYRLPDRPPRLAVPIGGFGGTSDKSVSEAELRGWDELTRASFRLRMFPGGHFYLQPNRDRLLRALSAELAD